jgi:hypothetical protein
MKVVTPRAQLDEFIDKYSPEVAKHARAAFAAMRRRLPAAHVLVYDNYIKSVSAKQRPRCPAAAA